MMLQYLVLFLILGATIGPSLTLGNGDVDTSPLVEKSDEFHERNVSDCGCSEVGCCSGNRTAAKGSNFTGYTCAASEYGCCPDGIEEAQGESFEDCLAIPSTHSAVCVLAKDRGTCHNFTLKWFFDTEVGACSPFWYRGCEGNENRFNTKKECEDICVQPKGRDTCYLPKIEGPCEGSYPTWYYDQARKQCGQVINGGCPGNANNFKTQEECEELCLESNDVDPCEQAKETGLCRGNFTRWYYNKYIQTCEEFTYGGCKGNDNNFLTDLACKEKCLSVRGSGCKNSEFGCCSDDRTAATGPNFAGCTCAASKYGCCPDGIEEAKGESFDGCLTIPSVPGAACGLEKDRGTCHDFIVKWFYDTEYGGCSRFWYGGCGGNGNRFNTREECKEFCVQPKDRLACYLPKIEGPCEGSYPTWYYDSARKQCDQVINGGCPGNANNFNTQEECEELCLKSEDVDPCDQAKETGVCQGEFTRWYYDKVTQACEEFTYGGCKGNENNFPTEVDCQHQCPSPGGLSNVNVSVPRNRVPEGSEVSIACDVDGYPNPRILWYKDGNLIQTDNRVQISEENRLIISNAKRKDSGIYRCEEYNLLSDKIGSGAVKIKVLVPVKLNVSVPQNKFPEGSEVSITCNIDGFWTPGIRWYKDDNVIQPNERMQIIAYGLIISDAKRRDSGTYRCEAYDSMSDKIGSGAVTIRVLVPVKLNVSVPQNKFPEGSEVSITCNVDGFWTPGIRWYKDDNFIEPNERMQIIAYGLIISDAKKEDSGTYRCESYDSMSDKIGSGAVTIKVLVPVKLNVSVPQNKFPEGSEVSITCSVNGLWTTGIQWYKDDNVIQSNERMQIIAYELIITDAKRGDSGTYRCEVYDSFSDKIGSGAITIRVLAPVKLNMSVPQNKFPEGSEVNITCNVDGFWFPGIRWYKDDNVIQPNGRMQIIAYQLIISDAKRGDSGTYRCEVYDSLSDKIGSGAVTIRVLVPVKLNMSVPQNKFPEGGEVSITCNVEGFSTPRIRWYKDDNVIQSNQRMEIIAYGLIISGAKRRDSGIYRCEVYDSLSDKIGSGAVTIRVLVPVKLNVSVPQNAFSEGSEVNITCNVDGFWTPGIQWYKDDKVIQPNERMHIIAYELIISDAKRRDSGTYRCEAYDSLRDKIGSGAVTIIVLEPVKLNVSVPQSKFPYGSDVNIACIVDGYPIPRILWYKDKNLIRTGDRVQISEDNELIISSANRDDSGNYRCKATNQFSTSSGSVEIEVLDVDEYLLPGRCFQFCGNEKCSFNCSCVTGYLRDPQDSTRCKAAEGHASLLVATTTGILNITLEGQEMTAIGNNTNEVRALDFDFRTRMIFWGDYNESKIYKAPIDEGNHITVVIDLVHTDYNSLAVDWIYNHIYWIDQNKSSIELANFEGNIRKTLITERLQRALAIALDPLEGWMFWTHWGDGARIESAGMDGSHRSIIAETELNRPLGLTLDLIGKRLYWVDWILGTIAACNYDGSERRTILISPDTLGGAWGITTFEDHVYWTEGHEKAIFRANKFTGNVVERVTPLSFGQTPNTVRVYHPSRQQDGKNQCQAVNCSHLCLPAPIINSKSPLRSCACPDGLKLLPDGITCVENGD